MLKEKLIIKRRDAILLTVDFSGKTIEDYAMAWLKLTNNAREYRDIIWKITNERDTNKVYVWCDPKRVETIKEFLTGITYRYDKENDEKICVGKVIGEDKVIVGLPVYEYESDCDLDDPQWGEDIDNSIMDWMSVREY